MLGTNPLPRNQTTDEERMRELREERQDQKLVDAEWKELRENHRDDQGLWNDENFTWTLKLLPMSREAAAEALTKKGIRVPTDPNCLVTAKKNQYDIARKTITMSVSTPEKPEMVVLGRKPETGIMLITVSRQLCEISMVSTKLEDTAAGLSIGVKASISMLQPDHVSVVLLLMFRCALQSRAHT